MAAKFKTIEEQWEQFAAAVLPPDCSEVQRTESRRCFYAGFIAMLSSTLAFEDEGLPEDECMKWMEAWWENAEAYRDEMRVLVRKAQAKHN
jgi:hypothetical protein